MNHLYVFSDFFLPILLLHFIEISMAFYIWKCGLEPQNSTQCHYQQQSSFAIFSHFPPFCFYISFIIASLSIFGSMHRTLKLAPLNVVINREHHLFFSDYLAIYVSTSIFGNAHWTLKILFILLLFLYFHICKCTLDLEYSSLMSSPTVSSKTILSENHQDSLQYSKSANV